MSSTAHSRSEVYTAGTASRPRSSTTSPTSVYACRRHPDRRPSSKQAHSEDGGTWSRLPSALPWKDVGGPETRVAENAAPSRGPFYLRSKPSGRRPKRPSTRRRTRRSPTAPKCDYGPNTPREASGSPRLLRDGDPALEDVPAAVTLDGATDRHRLAGSLSSCRSPSGSPTCRRRPVRGQPGDELVDWDGAGPRSRSPPERKSHQVRPRPRALGALAAARGSPRAPRSRASPKAAESSFFATPRRRRPRRARGCVAESRTRRRAIPGPPRGKHDIRHLPCAPARNPFPARPRRGKATTRRAFYSATRHREDPRPVENARLTSLPRRD